MLSQDGLLAEEYRCFERHCLAPSLLKHDGVGPQLVQGLSAGQSVANK